MGAACVVQGRQSPYLPSFCVSSNRTQLLRIPEHQLRYSLSGSVLENTKVLCREVRFLLRKNSSGFKYGRVALPTPICMQVQTLLLLCIYFLSAYADRRDQCRPKACAGGHGERTRLSQKVKIILYVVHVSGGLVGKVLEAVWLSGRRVRANLPNCSFVLVIQGLKRWRHYSLLVLLCLQQDLFIVIYTHIPEWLSRVKFTH